MSKGKKADNNTVNRRIDDLCDVLNQGAKLRHICQYVASKASEEGSPWFIGPDEEPLSERQIRRYVSQANKRIEKDREKNRRRRFLRWLAKLEREYAEATTSGERMAALAALREIGRAERFYPDGNEEGRKLRAEILAHMEAIVKHARGLEGTSGPMEPVASRPESGRIPGEVPVLSW